MKKIPIILIIVIAVVLIAGGVLVFNGDSEKGGNPDNSDEGSGEENFEIEISDFEYSPRTLTIKTGESVTWTNQDSVSHTVTSDSGNELDSELLSNGEAYTHTFNTAGNYEYHCTPHPNMKGTIVVE